MPNFEVLDARIASALNKIIHNSHFKRRISLEELKAQKQDRFFLGRQIAYLIYDYFRVTGANDSVENYSDLFTIVLRNERLSTSCVLRDLSVSAKKHLNFHGTVSTFVCLFHMSHKKAHVLTLPTSSTPRTVLSTTRERSMLTRKESRS